MTPQTLAAERPTTVIEPPSRWRVLSLRETWRFRGLIAQFALRDLRLRYRQTALGVLWVVLQPLISAGIFSIIFGKIAKLPSDGVSYFLFAYIGSSLWTAFAAVVSRCAGSLTSNASLVSKAFFPRLAIPLSLLIGVIIDLAISLVLGVVLALQSGVTLSARLLTVPVWVLLAVAISFGIGLAAAALMVSYRDVGYVLPVFTQVLMYASPIAYSASAVPGSLRWIVSANPITAAVEGFRWSLLGTPAPSSTHVMTSLAVSLALLWAGLMVFSRMERRFADVI